MYNFNEYSDSVVIISDEAGRVPSPNVILYLGGFAKLKKFQKWKKTWLDLTPPTHPPPVQTFFLETHH